MIVLDGAAATGVVGVVAVGVAAWGGWLSLGSSARGPGWALSALSRWRPMPWSVAVAGAVLVVVVEPVWVGLGVVYVGLVVGALTFLVRRSLRRVRDVYGDFGDSSHVTPLVGRRSGWLLIAGGGVIAAIGVWDLTVRGWAGVFGVLLAACLAVVGWIVLRRSRP